MSRKMRIPITVLLLVALTLSIPAIFIVGVFMRDPQEVSFRYAGPDRLVSDFATIFFLTFGVSVAQVMGFVGAIVTGVGLLKHQRWAWYFALGLHVMVLLAHLVPLLLLPSYEMTLRIALIIIGLTSLYLVSTKHVRRYLIPERPS